MRGEMALSREKSWPYYDKGGGLLIRDEMAKLWKGEMVFYERRDGQIMKGGDGLLWEEKWPQIMRGKSLNLIIEERSLISHERRSWPKPWEEICIPS